jgi:hypothetical protein
VVEVENIIKVSGTGDLKEAIKKYLLTFKEQEAYIVDRSIYARFGEIFKDGINAYSEYDLFIERVYKKKFVKMLEKEISHYETLDMDILEVYTDNINFLKNVADMVVEAEIDEVNKAKMIVSDIEKIIPNMKPVADKVNLPFFVNNVTEEEIPLIALADVTDEALDEWAEKLTMFTECHKSIVTPLLMSTSINKDGLTVSKINSVYWYDIIVR